MTFLMSYFTPSESQRGCINIKVCDRGLIDWWLGSMWPPAFSDVISHGPHQHQTHSDPLIQSIFSLSSVYFRMTAAELLFFLQTLRGLEQCLLFDP